MSGRKGINTTDDLKAEAAENKKRIKKIKTHKDIKSSENVADAAKLKFGRFHINAPGDQGLYAKIRACGHFLFHRKDNHGGQRRMLRRISENGGKIAQKSLIEIMQIRSASVSEIIGKLEAQGYIRRERNSEDRRNFDIYLTDEGKTEIQTIDKQHRETEKALFQCLNEKEKKQLSELLNKLLRSWNG